MPAEEGKSRLPPVPHASTPHASPPDAAAPETVAPVTGTRGMPPSARAAVRGGIGGNVVDQIHIFLPVVALAPALPTLIGAEHVVTAGAWVIAATLIGRPVGAMVFGRLADRTSRTATTRIAILGTAVCTLGIALLPGQELLGAGSLVLLLLLRFAAGIFLAGEYSAAIPLAMEWSVPRRRGLYSGLIMAMAPWAQAGISAATAIGLLLLGPEQYASWGWRGVFALGTAGSVAMLVYYRRRVVDPPASMPPPAPLRSVPTWAEQAPSAPKRTRPAPSEPRLGDLLWGRLRGSFWQVFGLMTGLWLMTQMVAIVIVGRLGGDLHLPPGTVSAVMLTASIGQAIAMSLTGHLSTLMGRRRFFVLAGAVAAVGGPLCWIATMGSGGGLGTVLGVLGLQVLTVPAYGPVGAYLTERFPREVRSTAYGTAYSLSIVVPALYVLYLPGLESLTGRVGGPVALLVLGGVLVGVCGALGPRLSPRETVDGIDQVAAREQGGDR